MENEVARLAQHLVLDQLLRARLIVSNGHELGSVKMAAGGPGSSRGRDGSNGCRIHVIHLAEVSLLLLLLLLLLQLLQLLELLSGGDGGHHHNDFWHVVLVAVEYGQMLQLLL
jgi:hypothetical protein